MWLQEEMEMAPRTVLCEAWSQAKDCVCLGPSGAALAHVCKGTWFTSGTAQKQTETRSPVFI